MPPRQLPALLLAAVATVVPAARAQGDEHAVLDPSLVPQEGRAVEAFVPKGWKLEARASGDLDGDGRPDAVLTLVEDKPRAAADGSFNDLGRALVILFGDKSGGWRRAAVAPRAIGCTLCFGMLGDPEGENVNVKIERRVIVVNQLSGAREAVDLTERYRYDAAAGRFALVGRDVDEYDRADGDGTLTSTNYLTGLETVEKYRPSKSGDRTVRSRTSRRVAKKTVFIEDVDYENP